MNDLVGRARQFATEAHQRIDQRRKYTNQPYQEHLKAVAELVASVTDDPEMIAAAWLHDTVEDTPATFGDIEREFGSRLRELVADLTDVSRPADGNRSQRKAIDRHHSSLASPRAKTVKLADLIDNCRDICRHDANFARVYLGEAAALLDVLHDGDAGLHARAQKVVADCARYLGLPAPPQSKAEIDERHPRAELKLIQRRAMRMFTEGFTAREIAQPLRSFDCDRPTPDLVQIMTRYDLDVIGLRQDGVCTGYARRDSLEAQNHTERARPFAPPQVVSGDAPLFEVIHLLTRYDFCFVTSMGDVSGVITRGEMQQPVVRMWLFGIITLTEMEFLERIRARWPDGSWTALLSAGRLSKAQALLETRRRSGQHVDLADCLQLSDKARIVMADEQERAAFGFSTKGAAKRVVEDLESLRNNLAHAQDIVSHDWPQIARLAQRIEETSDLRHGSWRAEALRREPVSGEGSG